MSDFREVQHRLTAWLRHPEQAVAPSGVEPRRLQLYRELLFNNVSGFVENGFPVLKVMVPPAYWASLVHAFFAEHRCQSPYFRDIPAEFRQWLAGQPTSDYPWLTELVHYEWAELLADTAEGEWPPAVAGDVWHHTPQLSPCVWPLLYHWPVHRFPQEAPVPAALPHAVLLYRTPDHDVRTLDVSLPVAALIERLQTAPAPLAGVVAMLAAEQGVDAERLRQAVAPWIGTLLENGILLGIAPAS